MLTFYWLIVEQRYKMLLEMYICYNSENHFLGDDNCQILMGHYFFLLWHVVGVAYVLNCAIFAKLYEIGLENYRENSHCILVITPLMLWHGTKYHYFIPLEILIYMSAILFRSITYFYSLLCSGKILGRFIKLACFIRTTYSIGYNDTLGK